MRHTSGGRARSLPHPHPTQIPAVSVHFRVFYKQSYQRDQPLRVAEHAGKVLYH